MDTATQVILGLTERQVLLKLLDVAQSIQEFFNSTSPSYERASQIKREMKKLRRLWAFISIEAESHYGEQYDTIEILYLLIELYIQQYRRTHSTLQRLQGKITTSGRTFSARQLERSVHQILSLEEIPGGLIPLAQTVLESLRTEISRQITLKNSSKEEPNLAELLNQIDILLDWVQENTFSCCSPSYV